MAPPDAERLDGIFDWASSLPPALREAFLERACGPDEARRNELRSLLRAHDASAEYFDRLSERVIAPAFLALASAPEQDLASGDVVSHYRILDRIGGGGMGVVYAGLDLSLGRSVALKFLPRHMCSDLTAKRRFLTEARAASRLDHPNIGVVHEIDETVDGRVFIAMAHYEGETLDRKIARGSLAPGVAVGLARQIARALSAAHEKGVVHRDVKPSNVMVTAQGVVKLLDFGIAQIADADAIHEGLVPGTPAYMSPEQTRGESVDQRTDLWSLGVVLHEMLTGNKPFQAGDGHSVIDVIQQARWKPDWPSPEAPPAALVRVIGRCLEKDVDRRYGRAEELLADLEAPGALAGHESRRPRQRPRVLLGGIAGAIVIAAAGYWTSAPAPTPDGTPSPGLAVLPLASVNLDPDDGYLPESLTSELIDRLSRIRTLRVIGRGSVVRYEHGAVNPVEIGRELDVTTLLEGTVAKSDDHIRLALRLVDARSEERLWEDTYSSTMDELAAAQAEIVRRVADTLYAQRLIGEAAPSLTTETLPPEVYGLYLRGRYALSRRDEQSATKARDFFLQALAIEPTFAQALAGWADALDVLAWLNLIAPADAYMQGRSAAERALGRDPELPDAHVALAKALIRHHFEFETAADHLRRAIELNPSHAEARQLFATYLRMRQRFDEALYEAEMAARLDPLSPMNRVEVGITLYMARRHDEALAEYRRVLDSRPDFAPVHFFIALIHIQRREYDEALAALELATPTTRWEEATTLRAFVEAVRGHTTEARARLDDLVSRAATGPVSPWHPAIIHIGLGEYERAIDLLEQAFEQRAWQIPLLPVEPTFDPLRSDARFIALLKKLRR